MTHQCSGVVFWDTCAFTLSDEPLPCGVEHSASECGVDDAKFRMGLHNLVYGERWKQPALFWQGGIQMVLQLAVQRYLSLCRLLLQQSVLVGLDPDEPSQVALADDISRQ